MADEFKISEAYQGFSRGFKGDAFHGCSKRSRFQRCSMGVPRGSDSQGVIGVLIVFQGVLESFQRVSGGFSGFPGVQMI